MGKIGDLLSEIETGVASPKTPGFPAVANNDFRRSSDKSKKPDTQTANSSRPISDPRRGSSGLQNGKKPSTSGPATSSLGNGNGTVKPAISTAAPPKKGSFAEIMARGKAAQATLGPVGKIQNKKIEKPPTRRERDAALGKKSKSINAALQPGSKFQKAGQTQALPGGSKIGAQGSNGNGRLGKATGKTIEPVKKIKKAATATTGYAGTARPKTGGNSSSGARPSSAARREHERKDAKRAASSARYAYPSEEEEDDDEEEMEEEDEGGYASSDMEAGAFEVDEEEDRAARIARQEDAEALREENRLKQEKLDKKKRLEAMAKKAGAKR